LDATALCSHLLGEGSEHAFLAEHRSKLFPPSMFDDLFPSGRGRPSVPAERTAVVMVLQALEVLSDRKAGPPAGDREKVHVPAERMDDVVDRLGAVLPPGSWGFNSHDGRQWVDAHAAVDLEVIVAEVLAS